MTSAVLHPLLRQSLFVAGTDTGVGKTWVCRQLLQSLAAAGYQAAGMKPVAAGSVPAPDGPRNDDALALQAAGNVALPYQLVNPICLPRATSPHLAAEDAAIVVDIEVIKASYESILGNAGVVIVEGAGGWLAPIGPPRLAGAPGPTMQDIALALRLPVLLVVGIRLGALSHALLAAEAIRRSGANLVGWAANCLEPGFPDAERYVQSLLLRLPEPLLWRS